MEGQAWRRRKDRREAGARWPLLVGFEREASRSKKEIMGFWFWRKGATPLMFQEYMRRVSELTVVVDGGAWVGCDASPVSGASLHRLVGGGLMSPGMPVIDVLFGVLRYSCLLTRVNEEMKKRRCVFG